MKEKIAVLTDTNCGLSPKQGEKLGIYMIPMPVIIDGETYFEGETIQYDEFFVRLHAGAQVSTSQPAIGSLIEVWNSLLESYEDIIFLPMSSGLSSSYETARKLSEDYDGRVHVINNRRISITLMQSAMDAKKLANDGMSADEVAAYLEKDGLESSIYVSVNTLEYLKRSGRVTAAGAAIGSVLNIKPVLQIQGGKLDAYKKVRGMNAACKTMIEAIARDRDYRFPGQKLTIRVAYSGDIKVGEAWRSEVQKAFPKFKVEKYALPLSICCHVGDGALGIGIMKDLFQK